MGSHSDRADFFAISDWAKTSQWLDQLIDHASSSLIVGKLDTASNQDAPELFPNAPVVLDQDGFFKWPDLDPNAEIDKSSSLEESEVTITTCQSHQERPSSSDVWLDAIEPMPKQPSFRTWATFATGDVQPHAPTFLSEAGPRTYDALLRWPTDPLDLQNANTAVVESRAYFTSLLALSLGRESAFFKKNLLDGSFKHTITDFRISGYSRQVLQDLESKALWCGSAFSELGTFAQSAYSSSSRCAIAFASALSQILHAVEERITVDGRSPFSLLQLESTVKEATAILRPLHDLATRISHKDQDEEIMSLVFEEASSMDFNEKYIRDMLCEILQCVSVPWVESIEEWIGTLREDGIPLTKYGVGESKGFVKVDAESFTDDFGREVEDIDFRLDISKVPRFLPLDVAEAIFRTGRNLRFIRSFHPNHSLARSEEVASAQPPRAKWLFDWDSVSELEKRTSVYQEKMLAVIQRDRSGRQPSIPRKRRRSDQPEHKQDLFAIDESLSGEFRLQSMGVIDRAIGSVNKANALSRIIGERLSRSFDVDTLLNGSNTPHWSLLPVLSFGSIASAQARLVNRESLRLLYDEHNIKAHLKLHRDFHLLGNGMFCSRLTHALFDPDLETAERQAGIAMQGGVMGLRLGGRDTWPPASSELRLALMGVLNESYVSQAGPQSLKPTSTGSGVVTLPGDLSFAVRDLSNEEIDKCMDPDSLEALDFLRLSYTTPPALTSIITPIHLMHYDRIFKLLVRTLRMLYVVDQLHRDSHSRLNTWFEDNASYRFVRESQHFVCSVASYFLDSGVAVPWLAFEKKLDAIRNGLDIQGAEATQQACGPDLLRDMHSAVIDRIMFALFLRKRQQPVLHLLESMFDLILRYAKYARLLALGREDEATDGCDPARYYAELKQNMQVFVTVCRKLSEKTRNNSKAAAEGVVFQDFGIGDDSLIAQLLSKLDLEDYYCSNY